MEYNDILCPFNYVFLGNQRKANTRSYPPRTNEWRPSNGNGRETNRQLRQQPVTYNDHEPGPDGDAQKPTNVVSKVRTVHTYFDL